MAGRQRITTIKGCHALHNPVKQSYIGRDKDAITVMNRHTLHALPIRDDPVHAARILYKPGTILIENPGMCTRNALMPNLNVASILPTNRQNRLVQPHLLNHLSIDLHEYMRCGSANGRGFRDAGQGGWPWLTELATVALRSGSGCRCCANHR